MIRPVQNDIQHFQHVSLIVICVFVRLVGNIPGTIVLHLKSEDGIVMDRVLNRILMQPFPIQFLRRPRQIPHPRIWILGKSGRSGEAEPQGISKKPFQFPFHPRRDRPVALIHDKRDFKIPYFPVFRRVFLESLRNQPLQFLNCCHNHLPVA